MTPSFSIKDEIDDDIIGDCVNFLSDFTQNSEPKFKNEAIKNRNNNKIPHINVSENKLTEREISITTYNDEGWFQCDSCEEVFFNECVDVS